jgi:cytochrome oxidase assembly protein ShyY1
MNYLKQSWKRWLGWLMIVIVFAIACTFLSNWQFSRRAQVVAANDIVSNNYNQPAVSIDNVLVAGKLPVDREWHPVSMGGHYVLSSSLLVRKRPYAGTPGFHAVAIFQATDGRLYLVDRGWLPTGERQDSPDVIPALPEGQVELQARLRFAEALKGREAPSGQLAAIVPAQAAISLGIKEPIATEFYLRLASEVPASEPAPKIETMPELSEGNHLSYAIQWIVFAVLAFATMIYFIRQEIDHYRVANDAEYVPKAKRKTRAQRDNEIEDAL